MNILVNTTTFKMFIYFYVALFRLTLLNNVIVWSALFMITDSKIFQANYGRLDGEFNRTVSPKA